MIEFVITHVFPGTERQKAAGIYATFNLNIKGPEGTLAALRDLKINKSKDGKFYIGSPYRTYNGRNKDGQQEEKKVHFIKLWPDKENWPRQDDIIKQVKQQLNSAPSGNTGRTENSNRPQPTASRTAPTSDTTPVADDVW